MQKYKVFTKTPWDTRSSAYYILLFFTSFLYITVFDVVRIDAVTASGAESALLILTGVSYCLGLFFILMLSKWVFIITTPLLFYIGAAGHLYVSNMSLDITRSTAPLFFTNDAVSLIIKSTADLFFLAGLFIIGLVLGAIRFFYAADHSIVRRGQAFAFIFIVAVGFARTTGNQYPDFNPMPFAYLSSVQNYSAATVMRALFSPVRQSAGNAPSSDDTDIILINIEKISDTALKSADSWKSVASGLNIFEKVEVCSKDPEEALVCSLTRASKENFQAAIDEKTITTLLSNAGYQTTWVTIANKLVINGKYIEKIAKAEADEYIIRKNDGQPNLFTTTGDIENTLAKSGKQFMIINAEGFSSDIGSRYPEIFNSASDAYENYMAYLDAFIYEVIKSLENRRAVLMIAGMSGEERDGGNPFIPAADNMTSIIGVWVSPSLEEDKNLSGKISSKKGYTIDQSWIFHSIIGCAGVQYDLLDSSKNICN